MSRRSPCAGRQKYPSSARRVDFFAPGHPGTPSSRLVFVERSSLGRLFSGGSEQMNQPVTPLGTVRFLKVTEVAAALRVSRMSVYRLIHSGEMEAVRVGRSFRVPEHAVSSYLRDSFHHAG